MLQDETHQILFKIKLRVVKWERHIGEKRNAHKICIKTFEEGRKPL
jgi:hypothetical protein